MQSIKLLTMSKFKLIKTIIGGAFFIFVIVVVLAIFFSNKRDFYGWRLLVVQSGSMEPAIKTGSLIFIKRETDYKKGDIATYESLMRPDSLVTHRITEEFEKEDGKYFKTKGDFNESQDIDLISKERVIGKCQFSIPFLGYPVAFAKTQAGLILLIVIPGTLIIYSEVLNIKKEAKRLFKKKREKLKDD